MSFLIGLFLCGLLSVVSSKALYPQAAQRPPDLLHDFQKDNISVSWAPGHPKEWTDKAALKYQFSDGGPVAYTTGAIPVAALSSDERFLVTVNVSHHVSVLDLARGIRVYDQTLTSSYKDSSVALRVLTSPSGYDVLVSMSYIEVQRLRLSPEGAPVGNITDYPGGLLFDKGSPSVSPNERRFITAVPDAGQYNIYDLDDPNVRIVIDNQRDDFYDVSFTPDNQYVVARSWSYSGLPGSTKMFEVTSGALVRDFNNTYSETLSISPNGEILATSFDSEALQLWSLRNATIEPVTLKIPARVTVGGFQRLAWSPDSKYLAAGLYNNLVIWEIGSSSRIVQWLQLDANLGNAARDVSGLLWMGSSRIAYRVFGGLEIYDFKTNLKYRWGFSPYTHWVDGAYAVSMTIWDKSKGWIGGSDADFQVRFWEVPK